MGCCFLNAQKVPGVPALAKKPFGLSPSKASCHWHQPFDSRAFDKLSPCSGRTEAVLFLESAKAPWGPGACKETVRTEPVEGLVPLAPTLRRSGLRQAQPLLRANGWVLFLERTKAPWGFGACQETVRTEPVEGLMPLAPTLRRSGLRHAQSLLRANGWVLFLDRTKAPWGPGACQETVRTEPVEGLVPLAPTLGRSGLRQAQSLLRANGCSGS